MRDTTKASVISAARDFQLLAENEFDEGFIASPAIAGNTMILRTLTHLYCIENSTGLADQNAKSSKKKASKKTPRVDETTRAEADLEALGLW